MDGWNGRLFAEIFGFSLSLFFSVEVEVEVEGP